MDTKVTLLLFPLFVMFMITLVTIGSFSGASSEEFFGTRVVTDNQSAEFFAYVDSAYDNFGENPNVTSQGGDWNLGESLEFVDSITNRMNSEFGADEGNITISTDLRNAMRSIYNENAIRITENDMRAYIAIDAVSIREWEELNAGSIRIDDVLVFVGIFFGIVILIGIIGIRIIGIGLADTSILLILQVTLFLLLWGLLSISAYGKLLTLPDDFNLIVWILLTFIYMAGVVLTITNGD